MIYRRAAFFLTPKLQPAAEGRESQRCCRLRPRTSHYHANTAPSTIDLSRVAQAALSVAPTQHPVPVRCAVWALRHHGNGEGDRIAS